MSSSRIEYNFNTNTQGFTGPTGATGPDGPTGATGNLQTDVISGSTGSGITGITGDDGINSTGIIFYANNLSFEFPNIVGPLGDSTNSDAFFTVIPVGSSKQDISENIVSHETSQNYIPNEPVVIDRLNITSNYVTVTGTVTQNSITLSGSTLGNILPLGNTGELLFVINDDGTLKARGAANTKWIPQQNQMLIDFVSLREVMEWNKNYGVGASGSFEFDLYNDHLNPTSFLFYNTGNLGGITSGTSSFATTFEPNFIDDGNLNYILDPKLTQVSNIPNKINLTMLLGVTGGSLVNQINFQPLSGYTALDRFNPQNFERNKIGSCCYCSGDTQEKTCLDYISQEFCLSVGGIFSTSSCNNRTSGSDCFFEGACCVYDSETQLSKCLNTTEEKCALYNGLFFPGKACNIWENNEYFNCPSSYCTISTPGRCCIKGKCFTLTEAECNSMSSSLFFPGEVCSSEAGDPVCCYADNYLGACCKSNSCVDGLRPEECTDGVFMGSGTFCDSSNCCGNIYQGEYFTGTEANTCKALGPTQNINCLNIGDKLAGGYFAGFVGMPNPCSDYRTPNVAFGEPLECLVTPRGSMFNNPSWRCKTCIGNSTGSNNGSIKYFARTYPERLTKKSLESECLLKTGVPFVQQVYELGSVIWPDNRMFEGLPAYNVNNGTYSYNLINTGLAVEYFEETNNLYRYLASRVYGTDNIHIMWALIVAPEDATSNQSKKLRWGMIEGRHKANSSGIPQSILLEEVSTYPVDGLLTTRIYDKTSTENPDLWFRDFDNDGEDEYAYIRFSTGSGPIWNNTTLESEITIDKQKFKEEYTKLWENTNPYDSAIRVISNINSSGLFGYSDWYIPSITELNYIYNNIDDLNTKILLDGSKPLMESEYWSSTSVSRLQSWSALDPTDKDLYAIEQIDNKLEPYLSLTRLKSTNQQFELTKDEAYKFTMSVANGQKMLTQLFNPTSQNDNGRMLSRDRRTKGPSLRPVRRIPVVVTCDGFYYNENILSDYYYTNSENKCSSCIDVIEGMCS